MENILYKIEIENSSSFNWTLFENDYHQINIFNEMKQQNKVIETCRHIFGVIGTIFSVFGIFGEFILTCITTIINYLYLNFKGNLTSLLILLKPPSSNIKYTNRNNFMKRKSFGSLNFTRKVLSFYAYLIALSICDLFSCVLAILSMIN